MKKLIYLSITLQMIFCNAGLFAQEGTDDLPPMRDQGIAQTLIMMAIALLFFYFILWRPEQKRRKEMDQQRSQIKQGDRVTAMGIVGTVVRVQDHTVILKMYDGSKIEVVKGAITDINPTGLDDAKKDDSKNESKKIENIDQKQ
jgi:preprotein translocase subunit YajC